MAALSARHSRGPRPPRAGDWAPFTRAWGRPDSPSVGHALTSGAVSAFVSNRELAGNRVSVLLAGACATVP